MLDALELDSESDRVRRFFNGDTLLVAEMGRLTVLETVLSFAELVFLLASPVGVLARA